MKLIHLLFIGLFGSFCSAQPAVKQHLQFKEKSGLYRSEIVDAIYYLLWYENSDLIIDADFARRLHPALKACIAYTTFDLCTECEWGEEHEIGGREGLECSMNDALGLGYQCSDFHLSFLRSWFRTDSSAINKFESCPTIPYGATVLSSAQYITVEVKRDEVVVKCKVGGYNFREQQSWEYDRINTFKIINKGVKVEKLFSSDAKIDFWDIPDDL
ncbi:MAG: hypothetical protein BM555_02060 [Crocinitomix sp. MedPE-SWsnd]|nr:MAG: hypothetical protein BM555_02060 [Crocinitomix sp. MedPE-SWsnd]